MRHYDQLYDTLNIYSAKVYSLRDVLYRNELNMVGAHYIYKVTAVGISFNSGIITLIIV